MKPEHAIPMLARRGHKLTTDEPLLLLLKLVDREELIRQLPQDRNRVKRLLMEQGYRIADDDPLFLVLDLLQIQYWSLVSSIQLKQREASRKNGPITGALSAAVGLVGLIAGIWLSYGRVEPTYVGVGAISLALAGLAIGCGWLVSKRGVPDGT